MGVKYKLDLHIRQGLHGKKIKSTQLGEEDNKCQELIQIY